MRDKVRHCCLVFTKCNKGTNVSKCICVVGTNFENVDSQFTIAGILMMWITWASVISLANRLQNFLSRHQETWVHRYLIQMLNICLKNSAENDVYLILDKSLNHLG